MTDERTDLIARLRTAYKTLSLCQGLSVGYGTFGEAASMLERDGARIADLEAESARLREAVKRQASAAITLANATKAISGHELETAQKLRAESRPELIESERAANARLTAELGEARAALAEAQRLLALLYDRWEHGTDCYEDPDDECGYLGHAVKLTEAEENDVLATLNNDPPSRRSRAMRVSDDVLMAFAESCLPGADRAEMARELLAARKVIASSRLVVEWAEPVTDGDWTEYDAAQRDLREYDAIMRDAPVEVPPGECPYPVHKDRSIKACVEAGDCGCGARDDGTGTEDWSTGTLGGDAGGGASKQNKHEAGSDAQWPEPVGWMTPGGDISRSLKWCTDRCLPNDYRLEALYTRAQVEAMVCAQEARRVEMLRKLGARLAGLLDEDQFAECEALLLAAGVMPEEKDNVAKA